MDDFRAQEKNLLELEKDVVSRDGAKKSKARKVILIMTVEIGDGRTGTITVRRGDLALDLARAFASEHGLDPSVIGPLEGHIQGNVRAAERKREARKAESARNPSSAAPATPAAPVSSSRPPRPMSASAADRRPGGVHIAKRPGTARSTGNKTVTRTGSDGNRNGNGNDHRNGGGKKKKGGKSASRLHQLSQEYPRLREERLERLRAQAEEQHRKSHTLTPRIDDNSRRIAERMRPEQGPSVFERLHAQAASRARDADDRRARLEAESRIEQRGGAATATSTSNSSSGSFANSNNNNNNNAKGYKANGYTRQSVGNPYDNYGVKLFEEGKRARERKEAEAARARAEREAEEAAELTFKPKLSKMAMRKKKEARETSAPSAVEMVDALGELRQRDRERLSAELRMQEMAECTFHPRISAASKRIVARMRDMADDPDIPRHEQLYRDAEQRRVRAEDYAHWLTEEHTFRPDIGQNSHFPHYDVDEGDFLDRLVYAAQRKQRLVQEMRDKAIREGRDPDTGEPLFVPRTGRGPLSNNSNNNNSLSNNNNNSLNDNGAGGVNKAQNDERLHSEAERLRAKAARQMAEREAEARRVAAAPKVTKNSRKILDKTLRSTLGRVFDLLDEDGDGYVEPREATGSRLSLPVAREVMPILSQFEEKFVPRERFVKVVFEALHGSKTGPKPQFFSSRECLEAGRDGSEVRQEVADPEATFRPKINERSEKLAEKRRRSVRRSIASISRTIAPEGQDLENVEFEDEVDDAAADMPIHETLLREAEVWAHHKATLFEERVEEELRECTFHPRVEGQAGPRAPVDPDELARRLAQKSIRSGQGSGQMTTEELELREHCTFRPNMSKAV